MPKAQRLVFFVLRKDIMASVNDKLITLVPLWSGTVGSGGVANGTETTIPLASGSGLTGGSIYVLTVDRVDSAGTKTLTKREVVIGEVSGDSLINCLRGQEGTAQAHAAGAVVEVLFTAKQWNRFVEGFGAEHSNAGVHSSALVTSLKASSSDVTTGTSDITIVTPKAIKDAGIVAVTLPVKATKAEAAAGTDDAKFLTALATAALFGLPEGTLWNGKIVPSVTSNNLTVALKGKDGNDPSATNPVYVMIGGVVRSVTAALAVTKNAATNWCNAGSAELATKEIDYFVYIGYNATDGVVIGFSRIPYATLYSNFSATTTNENYCGISTISNAVAGDNYVNVGRFAATLSAGAGYTWSVPTFTTANLIQRPIYETRALTWTPTQATSGSAYTNPPTIKAALYKLIGRQLRGDFQFQYHATSGGTGLSTFTLPFTPSGSYQSGYGSNPSNGTAVYVGQNAAEAKMFVAKYDGLTPIANSIWISTGFFMDI